MKEEEEEAEAEEEEKGEEEERHRSFGKGGPVARPGGQVVKEGCRGVWQGLWRYENWDLVVEGMADLDV